MKQNKTSLTKKTFQADRRIRLILIFCVTVFSVLLFRLWTLQILKQGYYIKEAEKNLIREVRVMSKRGEIVDRHGKILAKDISYYDVWFPIVLNKKRSARLVTPALEKSLSLLSDILEKPFETLKHNYINEPRDSTSKQNRVRMAKQVPFAKYVALMGHRNEFPSEAMIIVEDVPKRYYRYNDFAAHVLGRTGEIGKEDLKLPKYKSYKQGDKIGKRGVESQYESYLRGIDGENRISVDKYEIQRGFVEKLRPAKPGDKLVLTIDYKLQAAAEEILDVSRGAIVVADPRDGSILAMASYPRFDPNSSFGKYMIDHARPLYHRAIQGQYAPGSIFKPFEVVALLEERVTYPEHTVPCPGKYYLPNVSRPWKCHKEDGHGHVDIYDAVRRSCDVYFYTMVRAMGIDGVNKWANKFGLGSLPEIDLPEKPSRRVVFPTPQTKHLISNLAWQGGDIINISIGQGDVLVTPLQATMAYCAIANRGTLYEPRVAQRVVSPDGTLIEEFEPVVAGTIEASTRSWDVAQEGLWQVVNKGGTGRRILDDKIVYGPDHPKMIPLEIEIVGKTGTAEIPPKPSHAWFVCYANKPFEIPEIVITVLVENAGHGGEVSAPMAKKILDIYFNRVNLENSV